MNMEVKSPTASCGVSGGFTSPLTAGAESWTPEGTPRSLCHGHAHEGAGTVGLLSGLEVETQKGCQALPARGGRHSGKGGGWEPHCLEVALTANRRARDSQSRKSSEPGRLVWTAEGLVWTAARGVGWIVAPLFLLFLTAVSRTSVILVHPSPG